MSRVIEGRVTNASTASLWQELFSWFLKLVVAFFQLEDPRVTYNDKSDKLRLVMNHDGWLGNRMIE